MEAWKQVKENKGCGGIDGETIDTFTAKEEEKIKKLLAILKERSYEPKPVKRVYIPKKNGKGLVPSHWLYYNKMWGYSIEKYLEKVTARNKAKLQRRIEKLKEKGQEYYSPDLILKINAAKALADN